MGIDGGYGAVVDTLRRAGLPATREHILVAKLVLEGPSPPPLEDLLDEAYEQGLGLSRETMAAILERFRQAGLPGGCDHHPGRPRPQAALGDRAHAVSELLKAVANPCRYRVMCLLVQGERSVGALEGALGISQSALSQHLSRLRELGLVTTRRQRQRILYSPASPAVAALVLALRHACDAVLAERP